jgi:hypothetical protein
VTKAAPFKTSLRHWLEGDLLLLGKPAVWSDVWIDLLQESSATRQWINRKAFPAIATTIVAIVLWRWNGALVLALLMASSGSFVFHRILHSPKQSSGHNLRQWLRHAQAPLILSFASGIALLIFSYIALGIVQDLHSPWLALMLFTQEMGILAVLGLAIRSLSMQESSGSVLSFDRSLAGMLHRDPLRRLMAVRQLAKLAIQDKLNSQERSQADEYLQLLARQESDPFVNRAIQEGLAILNPSRRQQLGDHTLRSAHQLQPSTLTSVRQKTTVKAIC